MLKRRQYAVTYYDSDSAVNTNALIERGNNFVIVINVWGEKIKVFEHSIIRIEPRRRKS